MRLHITVTAAVAAALCAPAWAINKCTLPDGKVVFQDTPCQAGTGAPNKTTSATVPGSNQVMSPAEISRSFDSQVKAEMERRVDERSKAPKWQRPTEVDAPIPTITPGMTSAQVEALWGKASSSNEVVTATGKSEQWIYPRGRYETQYVFIHNNVVTSVSTSKH